MMNKKERRLCRSRQTRLKISELHFHRLSVHRTNLHVYAQVYSPCGKHVVAAASTVEGEIKNAIAGHGGNSKAAAVVGKYIAERAKSAGVENVAFDRSGFRYHGRVKALADAAREAGLKF